LSAPLKPTLEDHPLLVVWNSLYNIFAAIRVEKIKENQFSYKGTHDMHVNIPIVSRMVLNPLLSSQVPQLYVTHLGLDAQN
jgi:hypothetical protein